jgi:hypothetical protein
VAEEIGEGAKHMAVNDIWEVKFFSSASDQLAVNVLHFIVQAQVGQDPTGQEVADHFSNSYGGQLAALMYQGATFRGVTAQRIRPLPKLLTEISTLNSGAGSSGLNPLPRQVSGIITKRTALSGRAFRGRIYVPFPATTENGTDQLPVAGYITRLDTFANALITPQTVPTAGPNNATLQMTIFHQGPGGDQPVIAWVSRPRWGTQRRRGAYGAPNVPPF